MSRRGFLAWLAALAVALPASALPALGDAEARYAGVAAVVYALQLRLAGGYLSQPPAAQSR